MPKANHKTYEEYYGPAYGPETEGQALGVLGQKADVAKERMDNFYQILQRMEKVKGVQDVQAKSNEIMQQEYAKRQLDKSYSKFNPSTNAEGYLLSPDDILKQNRIPEFRRFKNKDFKDAREQYSKAMAGESFGPDRFGKASDGPAVISDAEEGLRRLKQKIMVDRIEKELDEANNF